MEVRADDKRQEEAIHDVQIKLFDEVFLAKHADIVVDAGNTFSKAVIVDTADKICHEVLSNIMINGNEDQLQKIKYTGAIEALAKITEYKFCTGQFTVVISLIL